LYPGDVGGVGWLVNSGASDVAHTPWRGITAGPPVGGP
jgi:hypothetical protein